jgi:glycerophosphoryl diester phosphodiesterase
MTSVITHRGLDPSKFNFFLESSIEAFTDQLQRGFGVEFDIQLTKDEKFVVVHDSNLERISEGKDSRMISEILLEEIEATVFKGCHIVSLDTLLTLRESAQNSATISALHLKRGVQEEKALNILVLFATSQTLEYLLN